MDREPEDSEETTSVTLTTIFDVVSAYTEAADEVWDRPGRTDLIIGLVAHRLAFGRASVIPTTEPPRAPRPAARRRRARRRPALASARPLAA